MPSVSLAGHAAGRRPPRVRPISNCPMARRSGLPTGHTYTADRRRPNSDDAATPAQPRQRTPVPRRPRAPRQPSAPRRTGKDSDNSNKAGSSPTTNHHRSDRRPPKTTERQAFTTVPRDPVIDNFSAALSHRSACPRPPQHRHATHQPADTHYQPDRPQQQPNHAKNQPERPHASAFTATPSPRQADALARRCVSRRRPCPSVNGPTPQGIADAHPGGIRRGS